MKYVKDAEQTVDHFYEKEGEFIDSIQQSLKECLTPANSLVLAESQDKRQLYKFECYDIERETGKFDAQEVDRSDININFDLSNLSSVIRDDHLKFYYDNDEKFKKSICHYINEPTAMAIIDRAYIEARASYEDCMKCPAAPLLKSQKRAAALRKKLNIELQKNPNLIEEQDKLFTSKFNTPRKRMDSFQKDDVQQKIREINRDLRLIQSTNSELQRQIQLIEKAKASLALEKSSIDVAVQYEKNRLAEAKNKLEQLKQLKSNTNVSEL